MQCIQLYIETGFANVFERYTNFRHIASPLKHQTNCFLFNPDETPLPWKTKFGVSLVLP